ncbi:MAG: AAA family ATPase [Rickettsia endosymbiont of Pentastiridius leporinus]
MLFLVGSRQVGKTTIAKLVAKEYSEYVYLNWDTIRDRRVILQGQTFIEEILPLNKLRKEKPLVIFDEIHKFKSWKNYLKGFYYLYKGKYHILVTGSARLDIYQAGGDSLMGRYFLQRIHPLSGRESVIYFVCVP